MPAYYDQPAIFNTVSQEDANRFQKLPFYLVKNEVKQFPKWNVFDQLFGTINWEPNEGNVMRGVTPQRSPVQRSFFFPQPITTVPNKDVYQVTESIEQALVYMHRYESFQFNFLPSFNSFWKNYIQFADKDIVEKIAQSNNQFIETNLWSNAPNVYLAGSGLVTGCPINQMNAAASTVPGSKTTAWLIATTVGSNQVPGVQNNLRLRDVERATINLQEDMAAPPFEGALNMPKDNEGLKGKYVLVTSTEAWFNFKYDPDVNQLKSINLDLLFEDFRGLLHGVTTVKFHRYPIRYNTVNVTDTVGNLLYAAGTPIAPEIYDDTDNKWKPNPYYTSLVSAPYEIAWMLGADTAKTIKVGPPPKEFSQTSMSAEKFYSLRWNGEVRLTDQVLLQYSNGQYDLNQYGTQLKFISQCTHGYLVGERRYSIPILFKRLRPAVNNV